MSDYVALVGQWLRPMAEKLPSPVQNMLLHPLAPKVLLAMGTMALLRQTNRALTSWSLNNGVHDEFSPEHDLVLLTGGCSGIGKQIMLDLAQAGARVVVLDIQEPAFSLRMFSTFTFIANSHSHGSHLLQDRHHFLIQHCRGCSHNPRGKRAPNHPDQQCWRGP